MRHEHDYMDDEEVDDEGNIVYPTDKHADERDAAREKGRYGPIRHLPGDFHPPKQKWNIK